ncbi:MAG TPA: IS21 family transposase [Chloroflexota bacterium]|nr:IS21 family transposase [Chloroflexota bacterium]
MELHVLHKHGWSISALAREFGLNWRTVKRELASPGPRQYAERAKPTALSEAQLRHVERRLLVCPSLRGTDLHGELEREYGYVGSYPAFARHLRTLRPAQVRDPEIRFETDPGLQTQADWAILGTWPLDGTLVELSAMVAILGCSRAPAIRFAADRTRKTSLERLARCLDDLGGATREVLTDRDPAFCIGATSDGRAILAPEWVDLCAVLGTVPKACRPYRAQTKGKVERMIREVKESLLPWLSGQALPARPVLADYDALARRWVEEVVTARRHRTTGRLIGDAWREERPALTPIPRRVLAALTGSDEAVPTPPCTAVIDLEQHRRGERVQVRDLAEYEVAL